MIDREKYLKEVMEENERLKRQDAMLLYKQGLIDKILFIVINNISSYKQWLLSCLAGHLLEDWRIDVLEEWLYTTTCLIEKEE